MAVGGDQVEPAVEVEVGEGRPPTGERPGVERQTGVIGPVLVGDATSGGRAGTPEGVVLAEEVSDQDVGQGIAVTIAEGDPHIGLTLSIAVDRDSEHFGAVFKRPVAPVVPECIVHGVIGDQEVDTPIAVAVGRENAHAPPGPGHASLARHVGEPAVALVPVEHIGLTGEFRGHAVLGRPGGRVALERCRAGSKVKYVATNRSRSPSPS